METQESLFALDLISTEQRRAIPILTAPGAHLIGLAPGKVYSSGEKQFKCLEALAARYPADAFATVMDLSVEAEAFGCKIVFSDNEIPTVSHPVASDSAAIENLVVPTVGAGRVQETLKCARLSAAGIDRPVFGSIIGPFSLAGRLADMTEMMVMAASEPELAHTLLEKATLFLVAYAQAIKETGVAGIIIAEPAAGLLSPDMFAEFVTPYLRRMILPLKGASFMTVLHNCGNCRNQIAHMLAASPDALHVGNAVNILDILPQVPANIPVMGNLDPVGILKTASVQTVYAQTATLLERTSTFPNYILSTGCDVPADVPAANLDAFFNACRDYNNTFRSKH